VYFLMLVAREWTRRFGCATQVLSKDNSADIIVPRLQGSSMLVVSEVVALHRLFR
jgi:hypothetical protein